ncbi:hypothetical protein HDU76_001558 [Blyttiomyces sp. JEL0837]|nr:hypothetical protein HDU76_001558 [Blyttiomyces sp. JEL0837]
MKFQAFERRLEASVACNSSSEWRHLQVLVVELKDDDDIPSGRLGKVLSTLADFNAKLTHISILATAFGQAEKDGLRRFKDHLVSFTVRAYEPVVNELFITEQFHHLEQLTLYWDRAEEGEVILRRLTGGQEKTLVKKLFENCKRIRNIRGTLPSYKMSESPLNKIPITHFSLEADNPMTITKLHSQAKDSLKSLSFVNLRFNLTSMAEMLFGGFPNLVELTLRGETWDNPLPKPGLISTSPFTPPIWPDDQVGTFISYYANTIEVISIRFASAFSPAILNCHNLVALFFNSFDLDAEFSESCFTVDHVRGLIGNCPGLTTLHTNRISRATMRALVDVPRLKELVTVWYPVTPLAFTLEDLEYLMIQKPDICVDFIIVWGYDGRGLDEQSRRGDVRQMEALVDKFKDRPNRNTVTFETVDGEDSGYRLETHKLWLGGSAVWWEG